MPRLSSGTVSMTSEAPTPHSPTHGDAVKRAQNQEHGEPGRKTGEEVEERIEQHIHHQRDAPPVTVCRKPEDQGTERQHGKGQKDRHGHRGNIGMKLLGDIFENENENEEIEGVERPAEIAGDDNVALLRRERADLPMRT